KAVIDPELGINIVDLGLVYRAERIGEVVAVRMTMTTPACPLGEMLLDEVRGALHEKFPQAAQVSVELVWDPPWSAELMSPAARRRLGVGAGPRRAPPRASRRRGASRCGCGSWRSGSAPSRSSSACRPGWRGSESLSPAPLRSPPTCMAP